MTDTDNTESNEPTEASDPNENKDTSAAQPVEDASAQVNVSQPDSSDAADISVDAPAGETTDVSVETSESSDPFHERGNTDSDFGNTEVDVNVESSADEGS